MRGILVVCVVALLGCGSIHAGEPGAIEAKIQHAFGSAPIPEAPESTTVQTPGGQERIVERTVYVEVPAPEKPGLLSWLGDGVSAALGFASEWGIQKPVNVSTEILATGRNVGTNILDGAGNAVDKALE